MLVPSAAALALWVCSMVTPADAQPVQNTKVGTLTCRLGASAGFLIGSRQRMRCRYLPDAGGSAEAYVGTLSMAGLDIGFKTGGRMVWAVLAPTHGYRPGALAGTYAGVSGDVALGPGVGANVLIGGSRRSIALQPLSVEGETGVNLAVGVSRLRLHSGG
jgi:hypothetical protein